MTGPVLAILLDTVQRLAGEDLDVDVYVVGSTQEETHSTGAITAAYGIIPDLCVAVDVTHGDSPDASKDKTFRLGGGPVIGLGPNCARWMSQRLRTRRGSWIWTSSWKSWLVTAVPTDGPFR